MKAFIVAILSLTLVSALDQYSNLKTQVGQQCASTYYTTILEFDVEPWPPVASTSSVITIMVQINQSNMGISTITYATLDNAQEWSYEYQQINQPYAKYSIQTFQYIMHWPSAGGNFLTQVTIGGINMPPSIDACWTFSYSLGESTFTSN